jgi:hypothetical protein
MSDSAPFNQQPASSKMQSPSTRVRNESAVAPQSATVLASDANLQVGQSLDAQKVSDSASVGKTFSLPSIPSQGSSQELPQVVEEKGLSQASSDVVAVPAAPVVIPQTEQVAVSPTPTHSPVSVPPSIAPHKEAGPVPIATPSGESAKPVEVIQQSTPEVSVPPEIKEVVAVSEDAKPIKIDAELKKTGVALAADSTPVVHTPTGDVKLPMTYADALATEKRTKFWDAVHWFAAYVAYQWRKLDPTLKD